MLYQVFEWVKNKQLTGGSNEPPVILLVIIWLYNLGWGVKTP